VLVYFAKKACQQGISRTNAIEAIHAANVHQLSHKVRAIGMEIGSSSRQSPIVDCGATVADAQHQWCE
jgi:hypothetical protein